MIHRTTAILMGICIATGFALYYGPVSLAVGNRRAVELVHLVAGFALPAPMLVGLGSLAYRADLRRLNRFTGADWRWLRTRKRRDGTIGVGKFNAGQKLNSALTAGSILVLLATGIVMYFTGLSPLSWRTGATFAHDWFALGLGVLVIGHITFAARAPEARRGMRTGSVDAEWAQTEHRLWAEEFDA